jgi:hypothetical protein
MRRILHIALLIAAAGFTAGGFRLLFNASRNPGWGAAAPALFGVICLIIAACLVAPRIVGIITYPVTTLLDRLFHPADRFTAPPDSLLLSMRMRILDRRFDTVDHQLTALLAAYGPHAGIYHVRTLLEAARGRDPDATIREAQGELPAEAFKDYRELLLKYPATPPSREPPTRTAKTS